MPFASVILWFLFAVSLSAPGIVIASYSPETNDRFANSPDFILPYSLSGVGISDDGRWATMISKDVFLTAAHYSPKIGQTITFYPGNDPFETPVEATVASLDSIHGTDIRLGFLDRSLPPSIAQYAIADELITHFHSSSYYLREVFMLGRSPSGWPVTQDMAVGTNRLSSYDSARSDGFPEGIESLVDGDWEGNDNYTEHEANWRGGDSGAPLFAENNGELELVGLGWYSGTGWLNGASYLGNHADEIQNRIPEPPGVVLVMLGVALLLIRRNRAS